jgi:hypothetical protein
MSQLAKLDNFRSIDDIIPYAQHLIDSGFLPPALDTPQKVATVVMQGRELGFGAMASVTHIFPIGGKPALSVHAVAALLKMRGIKYALVEDYVPYYANGTSKASTAEDKPVQYKTTIEFYEMMGKKVITNPVSFSTTEAQRMELLDKPTWKKMPKIMLRNRCLAIGARFVAPDAFVSGATYTVDEVADMEKMAYDVTEDGTIVLE